MRVCMIAYTFYEQDNRVKRYADTLARMGAEVDIIALKSDEMQADFERAEGINIHRIQTRIVNEKRKFTFALRLMRFLIHSMIFLARKQLKGKYDLVHVHNVPDFLVFSALIPKLMGSKVILDIHDILPEFYSSKFEGGNKTIMFKLLLFIEKISIAFADHVIISNHLWEKILLSRSVTRKKCTAIINYPDTSIFNREILNNKRNKFILLYPGSLNWHQGLDVAINAFSLISDSVPNVEFHIYGDGPEKENLINLTEELNLQNKVLFLNSLPISSIAEKMINSDLGIVPKRAKGFGGQAFSTKIMEFMAVGTPLLISETEIDKYYFKDTLVTYFKSGDANELAEKMLFLINSKEERDNHVNSSLKFIDENAWEKKKNLYLDILDDFNICNL